MAGSPPCSTSHPAVWEEKGLFNAGMTFPSLSSVDEEEAEQRGSVVAVRALAAFEKVSHKRHPLDMKSASPSPLFEVLINQVIPLVLLDF